MLMTCMRRTEMLTGFRWGRLRERDFFHDLGLERWMMLKWIINKQDKKALSGFIWLVV